MATILIADDHEVFRDGLCAVLQSRADWTVVAEASTGREAVRKAAELKPDIVIMDISMPELNGLEAVRQVTRISPHSEVCVLTMHDSEDLVRDVLEAGARAYVLKSDASRELIPAVESLLMHKPYFTPRVNDMLLHTYLDGGTPGEGGSDGGRSEANRLTAREREIVQLVAEGKSNKEIASSLNISVKTAETHRTNIMRKLDLHSVSELVRFAIRSKMIEP